MATKYGTKATSGAPAVMLHEGVTPVVSIYTLDGVSLSAGDVIEMIKVPNGAKVLDTMVATDLDAVAIEVGDGGDTDRYIANVSASDTMHRLNKPLGVGYRYDISDDAALMYDTLDVKVTDVTSATASGTITMVAYISCMERE